MKHDEREGLLWKPIPIRALQPQTRLSFLLHIQTFHAKTNTPDSTNERRFTDVPDDLSHHTYLVPLRRGAEHRHISYGPALALCILVHRLRNGSSLTKEMTLCNTDSFSSSRSNQPPPGIQVKCSVAHANSNVPTIRLWRNNSERHLCSVTSS